MCVCFQEEYLMEIAEGNSKVSVGVEAQDICIYRGEDWNKVQIGNLGRNI